MDLKNFKAFIFDMDGVLVDTENLYKVIEKELFEKVGANVDPDEHISYQGSSNPVMWSLIKEKHDLHHPVDELVGMTEDKVISYFNDIPVIRPMQGIVELLDFLKAREIKLALGSSSTIEVIRIILLKTGLARFFEVIADCKEAGAGKPDPAIFLLAQRKLGIPLDQCLVIEDSTNGIKASLAAGIRCIAYNGPGSEHQDQSAADLRIKSFREIMEMMEA